MKCNMDQKKKKTTDKKGKPGWLDDKTVFYYRRAYDQLLEGFEDEEDKAAFLDNVFKETRGEEITLSKNQTVSHILEDFIEVAHKSHVEGFLEGFTENYHLICTDRFASHVTQSLVTKASKLLSNEESSPSATDKKTVSTFVTELFNVTYGNMRDFTFDTYASHVLRALVLLMGGCDVDDASVRSGMSQKDRRNRHERRDVLRDQKFNWPNNPRTVKTPLCESARAKFKPLLEQFTKKCITLGLADIARNEIASPILQGLLKALRNQRSDLAESACERIMVECNPFDASDVGHSEVPTPLLKNATFCRVVEELVAALSKTGLKSLYKKRLKGRLTAFVESQTPANFILQRFLRSIRTPTLLSLVMAEILPVMDRFVTATNRTAIVILAEKCAELDSHQNEFLESLMKSLDCLSPPERQSKLSVLAASFQTFEQVYGADGAAPAKPIEVSLQGSLLLQRLLRFSSADALFNSFLALPPSQLTSFACSQSGSHVFEALFSSPCVNDIRLNKLVSRLRSSLVTLSTDKYGSRVMDALWARCPLKNRIEVAETLSKQLGRIGSDRFGKFISRNLQLDNFSIRRDDWVKQEERLVSAKNVVNASGKGVKRKLQEQ